MKTNESKTHMLPDGYERVHGDTEQVKEGDLLFDDVGGWEEVKQDHQNSFFIGDKVNTFKGVARKITK